MSYNWIHAEEFSMNSFLLLDRWIIEMICRDYRGWAEFADNLGIALAYNPAVAWYFMHKSPESKTYVDQIIAKAPGNLTADEVRRAEVFVLQAMETSVVYAYPEVMNRNCNYIYDWDKERLLELADFTDKIVLDIGSGTGRLAFAAAEQAKFVYASEPTGSLREYMRDRIKREKISNMVVVDGTAECIPYADNSFDIVMSGHVVGDHYDLELNELARVVKNGGYLIDCIGDDDKHRRPDEELLRRGFEVFYHVSKSGGDIYRYRKQITK
ncbi:class I SAM-dependent methyltransferase [Paenibacillus sp. PK3_47]|uniref:class I SAM-dependent methyltransferase n=1 Tax=Paenibacillus sp. PK3_47 TaxID=2072642 RepID=UPI00201E533D|nr:class I SAM-dependent methyltransferase [Paenibacillus sp. PK3_47]UQZ32654.1 class I SAM-dependent methyltransferase [Paenibacillus sp. PK3_47]